MIKTPFLKFVSISAMTLAMASGVAISGNITKNPFEESIAGGGRNIMRTADGGLVSTYSMPNGSRLELIFSTSSDNGVNWKNTTVKGLTGEVKQSAIDSNFQGSYIAFTEIQNGLAVGKVAFSSAPFSDDLGFSVSQPVTPEGVDARDTFIQASRKGWGNLSDQGRETVAYGWQDRDSKSLYIGVSMDGRTFPMAKKVVDDPYATSGPAVAIRGNFVIATYQTTNPAFAPADIAKEVVVGRSYPAWIESWDGGTTWSSPKPLFGSRSSDYPVVKVESQPGQFDNLRLTGGTTQPNSPTLNWGGCCASSRPSGISSRSYSRDVLASGGITDDKSVAIENAELASELQRSDDLTFVQSSMSMEGFAASGREGEVSVVSFRRIEPDAEWTHVIANNKLSDSMQKIETSKPDATTSMFQYSALIDTPIRATTYKEFDDVRGNARLVLAISDDTGKSFKHHMSLSSNELLKLGIESFDKNTIFSASQCLFEDRNGEVFVDILVSHANSMRYARIPVGVNAAKIRKELKIGGI
jgi:hypothetical protein